MPGYVPDPKLDPARFLADRGLGYDHMGENQMAVPSSVEPTINEYITFDYERRCKALDKALEWQAMQMKGDPDQTLQRALDFYAFLTGTITAATEEEDDPA